MVCNYLKKLVQPSTRMEKLNAMLDLWNRHFSHVNTIAVRGTSGLLAAGALMALRPDLHLVVVRKEDDGSHSGIHVESDWQSEKSFDYVCVDDLICSGNTFRTVIEDIAKPYPLALCVGVLLYDDRSTTSFDYRSDLFGLTYASPPTEADDYVRVLIPNFNVEHMRGVLKSTLDARQPQNIPAPVIGRNPCT